MRRNKRGTLVPKTLCFPASGLNKIQEKKPIVLRDVEPHHEDNGHKGAYE